MGWKEDFLQSHSLPEEFSQWLLKIYTVLQTYFQNVLKNLLPQRKTVPPIPCGKISCPITGEIPFPHLLPFLLLH